MVLPVLLKPRRVTISLILGRALVWYTMPDYWVKTFRQLRRCFSATVITIILRACRICCAALDPLMFLPTRISSPSAMPLIAMVGISSVSLGAEPTLNLWGPVFDLNVITLRWRQGFICPVKCRVQMIWKKAISVWWCLPEKTCSQPIPCWTICLWLSTRIKG